MPHRGKGRTIYPGQKIHASVAFKAKSYQPKATFIDTQTNPNWKELVGEGLPGKSGSDDWMQHLELDLFDTAAGLDAISGLTEANISPANLLHILNRLDFMTTLGKLFRAPRISHKPILLV